MRNQPAAKYTPQLSNNIKVEIWDRWAQKMTNSGHSRHTVKKIIISGLKGWRSKLDRCKREGWKFNRSTKDRSTARRTKKVTGKTNWFRKPNNQEDQAPNSDPPPYSGEDEIR